MKIQSPASAKTTLPRVIAAAGALCAASPSAWAQAQTQLLTNGGFETGDFTGWIRTMSQSPQTSAAGFFIGNNTQSPVVVTGDGTGPNDVIFTPTTPLNALPTVGAHSGNFYAVSDSDGAANSALIQSFFVPTGTTNVTLSFALFVNARNGAGAQNTGSTLNYAQATPTQFARVDLLSVSAGPSAAADGPTVLANFYLGVDSIAGLNPLYPTPYTVYANRNLTPFVTPGKTYQIRFADVGNQYIVNTGVDDVSILATRPAAAAPEPASATLALLGFAVWVARRRKRAFCIK